jgi:hypothetical protein
MKLRLLVPILLATACGDSHEDPPPDEEACEHLQDGPSVARTATASAAGAPSVSNDHMRYDVTLVDVSGGKGGYVAFAAPEAATYHVFVDEDVALTVSSAAGQPVAIANTQTGSASCTEIRRRYDVPLTVGSFNLQLGPTPVTSVSVVIEEQHEH